MRRRALLAGSLILPVAGLAAPTPDTDRLVSAITASLDSIPPSPALLASYPDRAANAGFPKFAPANDPAAYTYDNALAGLALLAAGHGSRAARIADALALAQAHDPGGADGRLRNAYRAGKVAIPIALPGWWDAKAKHWAEDPYQVGSETGPIAWAMLLWCALRDAGVNGDHYDAAARRAARWVTTNCKARRGFTGGVFGFHTHPLKLGWTSTEQNTDLAIAFARLGMATEATHAADFVRSMQNPKTALFNAGLTPDGKLNPMIAADANLWPYLAGLVDASVITPALHRLGWPRGNPAGIGFSTASQGIWTEGTGFAALALRRAGRGGDAARYLATARHETAPDGFLFTTDQHRLATGLTIGPGAGAERFDYYRVPALSPTAWAALAALDSNPLHR